MEREFMPYNLALELKELGFDEKCLSYPMSNTDASGRIWTSVLVAPLYQQAFRWFREKYKLHSCIVLPINKIDYAYEIKNISENIREDFLSEMQSGIIYNSYEEAELACLKKLIELAKEQNVK